VAELKTRGMQSTSPSGSRGRAHGSGERGCAPEGESYLALGRQVDTKCARFLYFTNCSENPLSKEKIMTIHEINLRNYGPPVVPCTLYIMGNWQFNGRTRQNVEQSRSVDQIAIGQF